jgi:hypothetical protein
LPPVRAAEGVRVSGPQATETNPPPKAADWVPAPGRPLEGYPEEWPVVALLVKVLAGWRCEHCGAQLPAGGAGDEALTVHHLEGPLANLMHWNLVPLCLRCHGLVERLVVVDVVQLTLDLGADPFPWLAARRHDRQLYPFRPSAAPAPAIAGGAVETVAPASSSRVCACGCGLAIPPDTRGLPRRYLSRAHQQRAYRERRAAQRSLLALLAGGDRERG